MPHQPTATDSASTLSGMTNTDTTSEIPVRLDFDCHAADFSRAMGHLDRAATKQLDKVEFDHRLRELVRIRASQINGCAYCIDMHTKDARADGETEQRIYALPAWRETPFFTDRERAALAFTESVTLLADDHVPTRTTTRVAEHFSPRRDRRAGQPDRRHQRLEHHRRQHPRLGAGVVRARGGGGGLSFARRPPPGTTLRYGGIPFACGRRCLLIDVDGTLVDSTYLHAVAWSGALRAVGVAVPTSRVHRLIGMRGERLLERAAGARAVLPRCRARLSRSMRVAFEALRDQVAPLPGARRAARTALSDRGAPVVLTSSAQSEEIEGYLEHARRSPAWWRVGYQPPTCAARNRDPEPVMVALRRSGREHGAGDRRLAVGLSRRRRGRTSVGRRADRRLRRHRAVGGRRGAGMRRPRSRCSERPARGARVCEHGSSGTDLYDRPQLTRRLERSTMMATEKQKTAARQNIEKGPAGSAERTAGSQRGHVHR